MLLINQYKKANCNISSYLSASRRIFICFIDTLMKWTNSLHVNVPWLPDLSCFVTSAKKVSPIIELNALTVYVLFLEVNKALL